LFNCIFDSGKLLGTWLSGNSIPIFKNKGKSDEPKIDRPIPILSCLRTLFTSILNKRLNAYSDEFLLINESQVGFTQGYSKNDNIFSLYSLFELLTLKKKKMFCVFIDFEKAFDTVWREGLWCKLLMNNINGKMHNVIVNMYHNVKSRIMYDNEYFDFVTYGDGVRQRVILFPFLFSLCLNDLERVFEKNNVIGLKTLSDELEQELGYYVKIFVIIYADDTAPLAESASNFKNRIC
jgi:hypothetical protein